MPQVILWFLIVAIPSHIHMLHFPLKCFPFFSICLVIEAYFVFSLYQGSSPKGHRTTNQNVGEAVFVPCQTPQHSSRPSTSATSSNFQVSSSSYESSASGTGKSKIIFPVNAQKLSKSSRLREACTSEKSHHSLCCSHTQNIESDEGYDSDFFRDSNHMHLYHMTNSANQNSSHNHEAWSTWPASKYTNSNSIL